MKKILVILLLGQIGCKTFDNNYHGYRVTLPSFSGDTTKNCSAGFMVYDATRRGSFYFIDYKTNKLKVVSEPPPDVVSMLSNELNVKANVLNKGNIEAKFKAVESIAELGKRTAAVNILRDALYKLAEIRISNDSIDARTERLFIKALDVACTITETEAEFAKAESEKAKATAETQKAEQYKSMSNLTPEQISAFSSEPNTAKAEYNTIIKSILSIDFSGKNLQAKDTAILKKAINDLKSFDDNYPQYFSAWELYKEFKNFDPNWSGVLTSQILRPLANYKYGMTEENRAIVDKLKK